MHRSLSVGQQNTSEGGLTNVYCVEELTREGVGLLTDDELQLAAGEQDPTRRRGLWERAVGEIRDRGLKERRMVLRRSCRSSKEKASRITTE